jgi:hypothetical protein
MNQHRLGIWFSTVSFILILFGLLYCFAGLKILPVAKDVLLDWESALYGAIMIGWGATLFLIGKLAFRRHDKELMKVLLYGIITWLTIEALFSFYLGVYFNIGVDVAVAFLFAFPVIKAIREMTKEE